MDAAQTRKQILEAADALFGERGFDATTTRDIAERSGVNKALIHYHFGAKDDLLEVVLEAHYTKLQAALQAAMMSTDGLAAQVEALLDAYADYLAEHRAFARIVQREIASGNHVEKIVARTLPIFQLGVGWLKHSVKKPPKDLDAVHLLTSVYGMVITWFTHGEVLRALTGKDPFSPAALAARKRHVHRVLSVLLAELEEGA